MEKPKTILQCRSTPANGKPEDLKMAYRKRAGLDTIIKDSLRILAKNVTAASVRYEADVMAKAMSVVWWDHVADMPEEAKKRLIAITMHKESYEIDSNPDFDDVVRCLMMVGYSASEADKRARTPNTQ